MKTIGVFFGGKSPEHDISILTGQLILSGLKGLGYPVVPIYFNKDGKWFIDEALGDIEFFKNSSKKLDGLDRLHLDLGASHGKLVLKKRGWASKVTEIDIAFPAFHGQNGEDGTIQGLFEILQIPYVGCGVTASAIAMDKVLTKLLYERYEIPTTPFTYFYKKEWQERKNDIVEEIAQQLHYPVFVKPARLGSSIGIAKANDESELIFAIEVALHYDEKILVEKSVEALADITCAVLGNDNPQPSLLQESVYSDALFSYEDKYLKDGGAQLGNAKDNLIIPAHLDADMTKRVQRLATDIFFAFGCSGTARVDFLYDRSAGKIYANEINTLPGTLYHHLWDKSGVALNELLRELIKLAEERHEYRKAFNMTFESDVLKQADWSKKLRPKTDPK